MSQRRVPIVPDSYYHIYNRGVSKQVIFKDRADYLRFIELLYISNTSHAVNIRDIRKTHTSVFDYERENQLVAIGAYCLMPNHFHILMTPVIENGVETFMRKVSTGFSMYFNKRHEHTGVLFEGRYKSRYIDTDEYLRYIFSYIHLNPLKLIDSEWKEKGLRDVKSGLKYLEEYRYGSYYDFVVSSRVESKILTLRKFPEYFPNKDVFMKEINSWVFNHSSLGPS
jgi:putative transposase